jgi:hypothetical protein
MCTELVPIIIQSYTAHNTVNSPQPQPDSLVTAVPRSNITRPRRSSVAVLAVRHSFRARSKIRVSPPSTPSTRPKASH